MRTRTRTRTDGESDDSDDLKRASLTQGLAESYAAMLLARYVHYMFCPSIKKSQVLCPNLLFKGKRGKLAAGLQERQCEPQRQETVLTAGL